MKNKLLLFAIALTLVITSACSTGNVGRTKKKAIGGVQSSAFQMGEVKNIKISADTLPIKTGCNASSPTVLSSTKDTQYDVAGTVGDWYALKLPNNQIGFAPKGQCQPIVTPNKTPDTTQQETMGTAQGTGTPKTPTAQTTSSSLTSMEQQMINLINSARAQNNLPALKVDMALTNVARIKAQDMIDNHYFSHYSPKYGSPFDMMKSFGINYVQAGENIAGNQSVQSAENALMNSPGHRKNILSPDFTHIGIGIKPGGPYGNMFSQMFVSRPQ